MPKTVHKLKIRVFTCSNAILPASTVIVGSPLQLDHVAAASAEHGHRAAEGILRPRRLHPRGQEVKTGAHVGDAGREPHAGARRYADIGAGYGTRRAAALHQLSRCFARSLR
jgi:hypothetical protein